MITKLIVFLITSGLIYFGLALGLTILGRPGGSPDPEKAPSFTDLFIDYSGLPDLESFTARDGTGLEFRHYPAPGVGRTLILLHGSGWHSRYLLPLARNIAAPGAARVYTPDLRGHGRSPVRRGDIDYIDQLVDDLADFIAFIKNRHPDGEIFIGGHSSGGGLALRFAGSRHAGPVSGWLLMAPFLKYNAPTTRPGSGGWARAYTARIIGLVMLNNIGLTGLNHLPVIDFNMPPGVRDGTETLTYSHRLNTGYAPADYKRDLKAINRPLLVAVGKKDESFLADEYRPTISPHARADFRLLPGVGHMGLVTSPAMAEAVVDWLAKMEDDSGAD